MEQHRPDRRFENLDSKNHSMAKNEYHQRTATAKDEISTLKSPRMASPHKRKTKIRPVEISAASKG